MNSIPFSKYHGLGNHFIIIDNMSGNYKVSHNDLVKCMYNGKTGIGADCLLELSKCEHSAHKNCAFELINYRSDGTVDSFCGNGSRCAVKFACHLGIARVSQEFTFCGFDGEHSGFCNIESGLVHVGMCDVDAIKQYDNDNYFVFTGSPTHVVFVNTVEDVDVEYFGQRICSNGELYPEGTNVIFVELSQQTDEIVMRSYERGVRAETLACGTGAVGAALVTHFRKNNFKGQTEVVFDVKVKLGTLRIKAKRVGDSQFTDVNLIGPASHVFDGWYHMES